MTPDDRRPGLAVATGLMVSIGAVVLALVVSEWRRDPGIPEWDNDIHHNIGILLRCGLYTFVLTLSAAPLLYWAGLRDTDRRLRKVLLVLAVVAVALVIAGP